MFKRFKNINQSDLYSISSLFISGLSIILSIITFLRANEQFEVTNQGYLRVVPHLELANTHYTPKLKKSLLDTSVFNGLNFHFGLSNVGKIPLLYKAKYFDLFINGEKKNTLIISDDSAGILYPDQTLRFDIPTIIFDEKQSFRSVDSFPDMVITAKIYIEYNDINSGHVKLVDRDIIYRIINDRIEGHFTAFRDKI